MVNVVPVAASMVPAVADVSVGSNYSVLLWGPLLLLTLALGLWFVVLVALQRWRRAETRAPQGDASLWLRGVGRKAKSIEWMA
jgi:hypothetical protein